MAGIAERAELVARLSLKDDFSRPIGKVQGSVNKLSTSLSRAGKVAAVGIGAGVVVAGAVVARSVRAGLNSLAELEDATTSVDGAIKQVGKGWTTTGAEIAAIANEIEAATEAAFDDKAITQATENLIRYGSITEDNLRPAMEVMTDLAAKTGDVGGASTILAKALAAPEKAAGKLTRMGIVLTDQQQKQITAMVEAGDAAGAQAKLLDILAEKTKGAAAASAGPYRDSINILNDVTEDAQKALATGFLPVISKVREELSEALAKPETLRNIREFGEGLAGALDQGIDIARGLPWQQIGDSFKLMGTGAKAVLGVFTSMPPWVQTAVLTGWGLNKLTGGALGSIVGALGGGLIKGVLGMNAGVVNAKAGVVNVVGGAGGVPGVAGKGGIGVMGKVMLAAEAIGLVAAVIGVANAVKDAGVEQAKGVGEILDESLAGPNSAADLKMKLDAIDTGIRRLKADPVAAALITGPIIAELEKQRAQVVAAMENAPKVGGSPSDLSGRRTLRRFGKTETARGEIDWSEFDTKASRRQARLERKSDNISTGVERLRDIALNPPIPKEQAARLAALKAANERVMTSVERTKGAMVTATNNAKTTISSSGHSDADRIVAAIRGIDLNVNISSFVPVRQDRPSPVRRSSTFVPSRPSGGT